MTNAEKQALLLERMAVLGIECGAETAAKLVRYQELMEEWNARINLTGDAAFEALLDRHLMDSLAPLTVEGLLPQGAALIDVGSGAGLPGLPLAIVRPDLRVTLLDAQQKRVAFLQTVAEALQLRNVSAVHARAEDAARTWEHRERFDVAAARAVAALPVLLELLLPFVRVGGRSVCYKGPAVAEELAAGAAAAKLLGGGPPEPTEIWLPFLPEHRHMLVVNSKVSATPARYPRKAGTPAKNPLGNGQERKE